MKTTLLLLCLLPLIQSILYHSLNPGMQLKEGDELVSTLGFFRASFISSDCSLNFYGFKSASQTYEPVNARYRGSILSSCSYLTILANKIVTNLNQAFLFLQSAPSSSECSLLLDDTNVLRFICLPSISVSAPPYDYYEFKVSDYYVANPNIQVLDAFQSLPSKYPSPITTQNWIFYFTQTALTISNLNNSISQTFPLADAKFSQSGLFDSQNQTLPYTTFNGLLYGVPCGQKKKLRGPFVARISSNWPVLTVYDQQSYKVFQYSIGTTLGEYSPCPPSLFQLSSDCLSACPASYYHQISNRHGECVLNCKASSVYDNSTRTCRCPNSLAPVPLFNCVNSTRYGFGCFCSNSTFLDISSQRCLKGCKSKEIGYSGVCLPCPSNCLNCSVDSKNVKLIMCNTCQQGYTLKQGQCTATTCVPNCLECKNSTCISCAPLYALFNNFCIQTCPTGTQFIMKDNLTAQCQQNSIQSSCSLSCLLCSNNTICIVCKPQHYLVVQGSTNACVRKSILFGCPAPGYSLTAGDVCYPSDASTLSALSRCKGQIPNCQICLYLSASSCLSCSGGLFLQDNSCVRSCRQSYYQIGQACLPANLNCKRTTFTSGALASSFNVNAVTQNQGYLRLVQTGRAPLNQPYGYQLFAQRYYKLTNNYDNIQGLLFWWNQQCAQCNNGYGLNSEFKCEKCPEGCFLCLYSHTCVANSEAELLLYGIGLELNKCNGFIQNNQCVPSCPAGTLPTFNQTLKKLQCLQETPELISSGIGFIRIEGGSFQTSQNKYIHKFVFSQPLKSKNFTIGRLLQNSQGTISDDGTTITIQSSSPTSVLNMSGNLPDYESINGNYPAETVVGVSPSTSFQSFLAHGYSWIGWILSVVILATHCIWVANGMLYKMDDLIILGQTLFCCLFLRTLSNNTIAQYYYGWGWLHLNFFPNYFRGYISSTANTAPPYALYNLDANFIRNAGSTFSLLFTFGLVWVVFSLVAYVVETKVGAYQIWFPRVSKNALLAMFELCSFSLFFWAVAYSHYDWGGDARDTYTGLTAMTIIAIIVYSCFRTYFDKIGGAFMVKRIVYSSVLGSSYDQPAYLLILLLFEAVFALFRYRWEQPRNKITKGMLLAESIGTALVLVLVYLSTSAVAVAYLVTLGLFFWYISLTLDLGDLYLQSRNLKRTSSWLSCFDEKFEEEKAGSSKEDVQQGTDRPLPSSHVE